MSAFEITPCTVEDALGLARTHISAFWLDPSWVLMWREKTKDYVISQACLRMARNLMVGRDRRRHLKATDAEANAIVGYARWVLPDVVGSEHWWEEARVPIVSRERYAEAERDFAAADWTFDHSLDELDDQFLKIKERLMEGKNYLLLDNLAVHPDYRHRGIGTSLVEMGIHKAERMGLDIFVQGKKAGVPLYKRLGFTLLEQLILDDSKYGGNGEYAAYFLIKQVSKKPPSPHGI